MAYLIGVDIGTSGTKTVIFDEAGKTIAQATIEYPMYQPENGWAEQHPTDWWDVVVGTLQKLSPNRALILQTFAASVSQDRCTVWLC